MPHEAEVIVLWIVDADDTFHVRQLTGKPFYILGNTKLINFNLPIKLVLFFTSGRTRRSLSA